MLKDKNNVNQYEFDLVDEVYKKINQPFGPGRARLLASSYYWDDKEGEWLPSKSKKDAEELAAITHHLKRIRKRQKHVNGPYDWYECNINDFTN